MNSSQTPQCNPFRRLGCPSPSTYSSNWHKFTPPKVIEPHWEQGMNQPPLFSFESLLGGNRILLQKKHEFIPRSLIKPLVKWIGLFLYINKTIHANTRMLRSGGGHSSHSSKKGFFWNGGSIHAIGWIVEWGKFMPFSQQGVFKDVELWYVGVQASVWEVVPSLHTTEIGFHDYLLVSGWFYLVGVLGCTELEFLVWFLAGVNSGQQRHKLNSGFNSCHPPKGFLFVNNCQYQLTSNA